MASDISDSPFVFEDDDGLYLVCSELVLDDRGIGSICNGRQRLEETGERWVCPDCGSTTGTDGGEDLPYGVTDDD